MKHPYPAPASTECGAAAAYFVDGWRSLAAHTGLPIERIAEMGKNDELGCLFGSNRRLLPPHELRSLDRGGRLGRAGGKTRPGSLDGKVALVEILGRRWPTWA